MEKEGKEEEGREERGKGREGTLWVSELSYGTRSTHQHRVITLLPHLLISPLHEILKQYSGCVHCLVGQLHEGNTELYVPTKQHSMRYQNSATHVQHTLSSKLHVTLITFVLSE